MHMNGTQSSSILICLLFGTCRTTNPSVYNSSTSYDNPITFGEFEAYSLHAWRKYPTKDMVWYPTSNCTNKNWYYQLSVILWHMFPAFIFDCYARMRGKKANRVIFVNILQESLMQSKFLYIYKKGRTV